MSQNTIVAISTAAGSAAIGVVRLSGGSSHAIVSEMFRPTNLATPHGYEARYGVLFDEQGVIDEAVALYFVAPNSYTGEDVVELSCHGNDIVLQRVVERAKRLGAKGAAAGEFTKRAFLNGKLSLSKAEAVSAIISGEGRLTTAAAAESLCGVLGETLTSLQTRLRDLCADIAAACDYPEEVDNDLFENRDKIVAMRAELLTLYKDTSAAFVAERGFHTAIIGRPNAGKSTLLNLLCGYDRAIVSEFEGTTRDVVRQKIILEGITLLLSDTAGLHETSDFVEKEGIKRSYDEMDKAELIIAVFEAEHLPDEALCKQLKDSNKPVLAVLNKVDLHGEDGLCELSKYFENTVGISAKDAKYRHKLIDAVTELCGKNIFSDANILATERQAECCKTAADALDLALIALEDEMADACGHALETAHRAICDMLLVDASEEVINNIFSRFCVGK